MPRVESPCVCCETDAGLEAKIKIRNDFERGIEIPPLTEEGAKKRQSFLQGERDFLSLRLELCAHVWRFRAELSCKITALDLTTGEIIDTEADEGCLVMKGIMNRHNMLEFNHLFPSAWAMDRLFQPSIALFFEIFEFETTLVWGFLRLINTDGQTQFGKLNVQLYRSLQKSSETLHFPLAQYIYQRNLGFSTLHSFITIHLSSDVDPDKNPEVEEQLEKKRESQLLNPQSDEVVLFQSWNRFHETSVPKSAFENEI